MLVLTAVIALAVHENDWKPDCTEGDVKIETRQVEGSAFPELRLTTVSALGLGALCDAIWGKDASKDGEGDFKKRVVISETATERLTYEQIRVPVVRDRDYVMHVQLVRPAASGQCEVVFQTRDDPAWPPDSGHVRLRAVRGRWLLTPVDGGKVSITYVIFSDPGGSVPALFARGGQRSAAVSFLKTILARAGTKSGP